MSRAPCYRKASGVREGRGGTDRGLQYSVTKLKAWKCGNMEQGLKKEIEGVFDKIRPSLGGADIRFGGISEGIVTVEYYRPLSNPSACHIDRTQITEDIIVEVLEDQLSKVVPGFKAVSLVGKS
jgi:hypothetical protein